MDKYNFDLEYKQLKYNYGIFKKLTFAMLIANLFLVWSLISNLNRERVILIPQFSPEHTMWIKKSEVSPEYLNIMTRNVLDLLLNITPENVNAQHQELLKMVASQYRNELSNKLNDIAKNISQNNLSQNYYIDNIRIINGTGTIFVRGILNQYIDKTSFTSNSQAYKITFLINNYMIQLKNIELLANNDPQLQAQKND